MTHVWGYSALHLHAALAPDIALNCSKKKQKNTGHLQLNIECAERPQILKQVEHFHLQMYFVKGSSTAALCSSAILGSVVPVQRRKSGLDSKHD